MRNTVLLLFSFRFSYSVEKGDFNRHHSGEKFDDDDPRRVCTSAKLLVGCADTVEGGIVSVPKKKNGPNQVVDATEREAACRLYYFQYLTCCDVNSRPVMLDAKTEFRTHRFTGVSNPRVFLAVC